MRAAFGGYIRRVKEAEAQLAKLVEVGLRRYSMIEEGDKILIAVSGGKDSTSLAYDLAAKRRWWPVHYELRAVHIATDFCSCCKKTALFDLLASWEIQSVSIDVPSHRAPEIRTQHELLLVLHSEAYRTDTIRDGRRVQ